MPFQFSTPPPFRPGSLFLGVDDDGQEAGITTERHAITVAGAGAGKGAALIIPNLKRWPHAALVIDPKGENAEQTWRDREAMGQAVYALDPFRVADLPDHVRASFNPLAEIDPDALTAREDIRAIADGMVLRPNARDADWYDGGVDVLSGFIAHVVTSYAPDDRSLELVRSLLNTPQDDGGQDQDGNPVLSSWENLLLQMGGNPSVGGLAQGAAALLGAGAKSAREHLATARRSIDSFGSDAMRATMAESSFRLSDLKRDNCTVFLILPPHYLREHARFLRLFVRLALNVMAHGGNRKGGKCLFILDEFFSLGRIDEIATAAGLMRSYGVQLWPFLQDLGQLLTLYDREGSETFFGNSDARIFFGNTDQTTLAAVSEWLDRITPDEIAAQPPQVQPFHEWRRGRNFWNDQEARDAYQAAMENLRAQHAHKMAMSGRARLSPPEVAGMVAKKPGDAVARSMIVFGPGDDVFRLRLAPYFQPAPEPIRPPAPAKRPPSTPTEWYFTGACCGYAVVALMLSGKGPGPFGVLTFAEKTTIAVILGVAIGLAATALIRRAFRRG